MRLANDDLPDGRCSVEATLLTVPVLYRAFRVMAAVTRSCCRGSSAIASLPTGTGIPHQRVPAVSGSLHPCPVELNPPLLTAICQLPAIPIHGDVPVS